MLIPDDIASVMTPSALKIIDTDWYMDRIYHFAIEMGCSVLNPRYSRYVIDLNRPENDAPLYPGADTTELCPTTQFDSKPIYIEGKNPDEKDISNRIETYWRPYHEQLKQSLEQMHQQFGYALLFEAHSIKSVVPRFFEGQLADFNFGNFDNKSCSVELTTLVNDWQPKKYSKVVNGRFKGGHITRHYGDPANKIDSLQLELSQATYLDESSLLYNEVKADEVIKTIKDLFKNLQIFSESKRLNN